MTRPVHPPLDDEDLPSYLDEPPPAPHAPPVTLEQAAATAIAAIAALARTVPEPLSGPVGVGPAPLDPSRLRWASGTFFRCVDVPGRGLAAAVDRWWESSADGETRRVARTLRLERPAHRDGLSSMTGRLRRLTRWHSVPVVLELWPHTRFSTCVVLRPEKRVFASRRYFRLGHRALDRLGAELLAAAFIAVPGGP